MTIRLKFVLSDDRYWLPSHPHSFLPHSLQQISTRYLQCDRHFTGPALGISQLHLTCTWGSPGCLVPLSKPAGGQGPGQCS